MPHRPPLHYPDRPFHHFLQDSADRRPESIALVHSAGRCTFRDLDGWSNACAHALRARGVGVGSRVAVVAGNRLETVIVLFAVSQLGASAVLLNPRWTGTELAHKLGLTNPAVLIADAAAVTPLNGLGADAIRICVDRAAAPGWLSLDDLMTGAPGDRLAEPAGNWREREIALPFSSGTTGMPKAVRHTHRSLVAGTIQWKAAGGFTEDDRPLLFLPLFHVYGMITVAAALAAGASLHLHERFDVATCLDTIERERITLTFGAAPVAFALAQQPDLEQHDLSSLRCIVWGATPMDTERAEAVTRRTGVRWLHAYGATEAPLLHCNPMLDPDQWRLDSPGLPVSDLAVRVVDLETRRPLKPGETGEILVKGPQVAAGYLPPDADAETFEDGWLRTGDIGWVEPGDWLHIVDRAKEMIKVSGFQVAPVELERLLLTHPGVSDCAVFGMPEIGAGEVPVAAVVREPDSAATATELVEFVACRVASYKALRQIRFVDQIPRTASGKILRRLVRDQQRTQFACAAPQHT